MTFEYIFINSIHSLLIGCTCVFPLVHTLSQFAHTSKRIKNSNCSILINIYSRAHICTCYTCTLYMLYAYAYSEAPHKCHTYN